MLEHDEQVKSLGQWVVIGSYFAYIALAWIGTELLAPSLGYEFAAGLFVAVGIFVVVGVQRLGERAEWWMAAQRRKSSR